jgi:tetratricopeptide (TPR) repeat protein
MRQVIFIFLVATTFSAFGQGCVNVEQHASTWTYDSLYKQGTEFIFRGLFGPPDLSTKHFEAAICLLDMAVKKGDNRGSPYSWRGLAKKSMYQFESALVDYTKAAKLEPSDFKNYEGKAECKAKLKDHYGAIEDYLRAINLTNEKEYSEYHALLGSLAGCYYVLGNFDLALANINRAIYLNKENSKYYLIRGLIKVELKKVKEACLDFSKAGELGNPQAFVEIKENCL